MKKLIVILTCTLAILSGCSLTEIDSEQQECLTPRLSIDEAKAAFEDTYLTALTKTGNSTDGKANKLTTGDFTPLWDKASYSENGKACSYDVNLIAERKVYAAVAKFENGHASAEKVRVYQRLVVIKNDCYPRTCCYMLSLIPDCGCDGGERMAEQFRSCADKGLFSGLAVYSTLGSQAIIRVDRYCNGVRKDGVYIPDGKGAYRQRLEKAAGMLSGISFFNRRNITTKSFGEDFWDDDDDYGWDYGDSDDYTSVGGGFYEDSAGNLYYDTDGDGIPDSMVIDESTCMPDFDDSYLWNPTPDDDYMNNDSNNDGGYFGGTGKPGPQLDTIRRKPADLSKFYGTKEFYRQRELDFKRRNPRVKPPAYYMQYGYVYCQEFNEVTRKKLSPEGQLWCDRVTVALQKELDFIIMNSPFDIELFPDLLTSMAFQSHVNAYVDSGILELSLHDKLYIFLTVNPNDLLSYNGTKQVEAVMLQQTLYYATHPSSALTDSEYICDNINWIWQQIKDYVQDHGSSGTKSSNGSIEEEIFNLIFGQLIDYYENNIPGFKLPA